MSIKIYRQNTTSSTIAPPPSLQYGMISCDKSGCLYVGDSSNNVIEQMNVVKYQEVGNPNLLDNSKFMIAQQGYNGAHSGVAFVCDRWNRYLTTGAMTSNGLQLTSTNVNSWIIQRNVLDEAGVSLGDNLTISIMLNGSKYTGTVALAKVNTAGSADIAIENDYIKSTVYVSSDTADRMTLIVWIKQTCTIKWIKMEKGSVATPYVPKSLGDEFLECLRYFVGGVGVGSAGIVSGSSFRVLIPTPVPMRTTPTVTIKIPDNVVYNGTFKALNTTVSSITRQRNGIHLNIGMAASGVTNEPAVAYGLNCDLSADI